MPTLAELNRLGSALSSEQLLHLKRLVSWLGLLADLSFSDLLLFVPAEVGSKKFAVVSQIRPTTGQTLYKDDHVGMKVNDTERPLIFRSYELGRTVEGEVPIKPSNRLARVTSIPVVFGPDVIAVLSREVSPDFLEKRDFGELERNYLETFARFSEMISAGLFPLQDEDVNLDEVPRVGDGLLVLDKDRRIEYISPNALSNLHRIGVVGNVTGRKLEHLKLEKEVISDLITSTVPVAHEIEQSEVIVQAVAVPIFDSSGPRETIILLRDVTELRRRDRLLLSKDATIREIHHRVKNNLQTISSLLRLQGRRLESFEAKIAIEESVRRIRAIALVHETLANVSVDDVSLFEVAQLLARTAQDSFTSKERPVEFSVHGDVGLVPSVVVTQLAVVLNELLQNAVDHAFPSDSPLVDGLAGTVEVHLSRPEANTLVMKVLDDGIGLPPNFNIEEQRGLGTSIIRALASSELGGGITMRRRIDSSGSEALVQVPIASTE